MKKSNLKLNYKMLLNFMFQEKYYAHVGHQLKYMRKYTKLNNIPKLLWPCLFRHRPRMMLKRSTEIKILFIHNNTISSGLVVGIILYDDDDVFNKIRTTTWIWRKVTHTKKKITRIWFLFYYLSFWYCLFAGL